MLGNFYDYSKVQPCLVLLLIGMTLKEGTHEGYAIGRKAGSLVLLDTIGIHGGVSVMRGERWIARFHLVDRKYRFWNHPEQEGFLMRLFSLFCRKVKRIVGC